MLACNLNLIFGYPGIVESNIDLRKTREKSSEPISTKLTSSYNNRNSITKDDKIEKFTQSHSTSFHPMKFGREDVVEIHPSFGSSTPSLASGGVIFAISRGHESTSSPLIASGLQKKTFKILPLNSIINLSLFFSADNFGGHQPVLMQYLSPEGEPHQSGVSYIQLLRPIMMVPAQPYLPAQPVPVPSKPTMPTTTTNRPTMSYTFFPRDESTPYAAPLTQFMPSEPPREYSQKTQQQQQQPTFRSQQQQQSEIDFNMNEYLPSASTQSFASVLPPSQPNFFPQFQHYRAPQPQRFQRFAQRA